MKGDFFRIRRVPEFREWYDSQTEKGKVQIDGCLSNMQLEGHFGDHKCVGSENELVWELRWKNGRRIYFAYIPEKQILLLSKTPRRPRPNL